MSFLPGTASLIKEIDKKLLVVLRDNRTLIGYLRSIDQFANLVLQGTIERIHVGDMYGDIPRGIFVVRGENVVLLGEIDQEKENKSILKEVSVDKILEAQRAEQIEQEEQEKAKNKARAQQGMPVNSSETYLTHDDRFI
ncbi:U6 snRNA-associated Sm-like protein LSm1 [Exaiptasia diaphana]|uniref:U6 snRNA-associated Sm-like protein LSm1 n=1 Tax=Exaiptasia diaphana TaxID=2652724 RepID=A0A913XD03_EXADI|nr:U6 snRNA-associated Sm-like protein LSm1 [Exaiptasia diaphana]KXJ29754.1 U6 snRNA-associated Sm-like protein LSm1 [Exaiptasia diaphana]